MLASGVGKPKARARAEGGDRVEGVRLSTKNELTISLRVGGMRERGGTTADVDAVGDVVSPPPPSMTTTKPETFAKTGEDRAKEDDRRREDERG